MVRLGRALRALLGLLLRRPILGTSIVPCLADGQVVLIRRRDSGLWGLPGGIVDWGEDIETAARRELREETGLEIEMDAQIRLVGIYSHPERDPRFHSVCVAIAASVTGVPQIGDPQEVLEVRAFPPEQVLSLSLAHDHYQHMADFLAGVIALA